MRWSELIVASCILAVLPGCATAQMAAKERGCGGRVVLATGAYDDEPRAEGGPISSAKPDREAEAMFVARGAPRSSSKGSSDAQALAARALEASGFCCSRSSLERGLACRGHFRGPRSYPDDVVFFVPPGFKPSRRARVIVHFHGHLINTGTVRGDVLDEFDFARLLARSGRDRSILVLPLAQSRATGSSGSSYERTSGETFKEYFGESRDRFAELMDDVDATLGPPFTKAAAGERIGEIALVGHSGAYVPLNAILSGDSCSETTRACYGEKITELYLLDALYGPTPDLTQYVATHDRLRFMNVYRSDAAGTLPASQAMELELCRASLGEQAKAEALRSCVATLETPRGRGLRRFLQIDKAAMRHMDVVPTFFPALLAQ